MEMHWPCKALVHFTFYLLLFLLHRTDIPADVVLAFLLLTLNYFTPFSSVFIVDFEHVIVNGYRYEFCLLSCIFPYSDFPRNLYLLKVNNRKSRKKRVKYVQVSNKNTRKTSLTMETTEPRKTPCLNTFLKMIFSYRKSFSYSVKCHLWQQAF